MESTQDRLAAFVKHTGLSDNQFTIKTGLSNGLLGNITKKKASFTNDTAEKILSAFPQLNIDWILRGKGEMLLMDEPSLSLKEPEESYFARSKSNHVYLYPENQLPSFPLDDNTSLTSFSLPWLGVGEFWAFKVEGNAMQHSLTNGDYVITKELGGIDWLKAGEIHVLLTTKGINIKRVLKQEKGKILLRSDNGGGQEEEISSSLVKACFLVISKWTSDFGNQQQQLIRLYNELLKTHGIEIKP